MIQKLFFAALFYPYSLIFGMSHLGTPPSDSSPEEVIGKHLPKCDTREALSISPSPCELPRYTSIDSITSFEELVKRHRAYRAPRHRVVVIFDIDKVLCVAKNPLASDEAFSYMHESYEKDLQHTKSCYREEFALASALIAAFPFQRSTKLMAIESRTIELISELQAQGIPVYALTSRSIHRRADTVAQLKTIEISETQTGCIDFSRSINGNRDIQFRTRIPSRFSNGILFCGINDKGEMLYRLLCHLKMHTADCIFFIDDRKKNCLSVLAAMEKYHIPALCRRYAYLDHAIDFNPADIPEDLKHLDQKEPVEGRDCLSPKPGTPAPFYDIKLEDRPLSR